MDTNTNFIYSPPRGGFSSSRIQFPGFSQSSGDSKKTLNPGEATWIELADQDIVQITFQPGAMLALAGIDFNQPVSLESLNLGSGISMDISASQFRSTECLQQLANRGLSLSQLSFLKLIDPMAALTLRSDESISILAICMVDTDGLVSGDKTGAVQLDTRRGNPLIEAIPAPLGEVRDEFTIDRCSARAYQLNKGEFVQVIDLQGCQCSDFMAMNAQSLDRGDERYIDSTITRTLMGGAYPMPGLFDKFFDQDMKPLLALIQDTVGRHDTFALACTARGYEDRGFPGHINCSDNISAAYKPYGIKPRRAWPAINFFFNSWIYPSDNRINSAEAWSRPGDYVLMQALNDLVCVSTACPDDVDPINGWNPTDIHVRIYRTDMQTRKSVAYRATTEAAPILTQESPFHARTSKLTRHFTLGRDYWMPQVFDATGAIEEYWACHQSATIQDMSSLRKLDITGPDAEGLLQRVVSRDVSQLAVNRGFYALILDESGIVIDDGTLFRLGADVFRWCCGSDDSGLHLAKQAEQGDYRVWIKDLSTSLCNIAVQGPNSRDILRKIVFTRSAQPEFDNIKWFGFAIGRLFDREGRPFMIARSGYTGQLGYEIFCDQADALVIWDAVIEAGADLGLKVQGNQALEMLRVEAGFMAVGAEFTDDVDADEAGLGFAVDLNKSDFIGKSAIERNRSAARKKLVGLIFDGDEVPVHGDGIFIDRRQVGVITSATRSPSLAKVIAMARVSVEYAQETTPLAVGKLDGHMKRLPCRVCGIPFIDPARQKPRS